jgi:hypothetical protein
VRVRPLPAQRFSENHAWLLQKERMQSVQKWIALIREHSIFYRLLPISVNQDQVVRTLPANCCVMKTCDVAAHIRIFTDLDDFKSAPVPLVSPLNELARSKPSEVMSRYSTSAKNFGSTHVAFGFLIARVSLLFERQG